ncbi:MAG TPA: hypothetical protein VKJ07_14620, partial [Mycobacteriales bacterium]|nr:hypothetical protein [Mycobacteriales bacterium]
MFGFADASLGRDGGRVLEGRLPHERDPGEASVNFVAAEKRHVRVGQTIDLHLAGPGYSGEGELPPGPDAHLRVVGITASLGDFASVANAGIAVTPAFIDAFRDRTSVTDIFMFVLRRKSLDLPAFRNHISELTGGRPVIFVEGRNDWIQTQRSFHVQAVSLWLLAAILGVVAFLVLTQLLARLVWTESADHTTLSVLGMTRPQRWALAAARGAFLGTVAAVIATVVAVATSWLMPIGRPRLAEIAPGLWAPVGFLAAGFALTFVAVLLQSTLPALVRRRDQGSRSAVAGKVAAVVPGPAAAVGVRFALEPGRGSQAVPVRSTVAGATLGVLAVVMALTVSASLAHLLDTPRLYGWGWDAAADFSQTGPEAAAKLEQMRGIAAVGYGNVNAQASVGEH